MRLAFLFMLLTAACESSAPAPSPAPRESNLSLLPLDDEASLANDDASSSCARRFVAERGNDASGSEPNDCSKKHEPCATVTHAIAVACPGDVVRLGAGTFVENVVIDKALKLRGESAQRTRLLPAVSNPNPCDDTALCDGNASTSILVRASDVDITLLTVDGDNPQLAAPIDARNGIITDTGAFDRLSVRHVRVVNVFLRGIQNSYGRDFLFSHNDVRRVQGNEQAIGIFTFGGSGRIADNDVVDCNTAISLNHSLGTKVVNNRIRGARSALHTDNAGDGVGAVADELTWNEVRDCGIGNYGIWVFVPYVAPIISHNDVEGCSVGLAVFAQGAADVAPVFESNSVDGQGVDAVGVYLSNSELGYGDAGVDVVLTGNVITHNSYGIYASQTAAQVTSLEARCNWITNNGTGVTSQTASGHLNGNTIKGNGVGVDGTGIAEGALDVTQNYWGCKEGPGFPRCDSVKGALTVEPVDRTASGCFARH